MDDFMKPHCLVCGMELLLVDYGFENKKEKQWWYCDKDGFRLLIYRKNTGKNNILMDDFSINKEGNVFYG